MTDRRPAEVVPLDHYRPVWRTGDARCAACRCRWGVLIHVEVRLGDVRCPRCGVAGNVTLSGLSAPGPVPEDLRASARRADRVRVGPPSDREAPPKPPSAS